MFKPKNASFAKFMCLTAALFLVAFGLFANSATSAAVAPMPDYAEVTAVYTERPVAPVSLREEAVEKVALDETGANIEEKMKDALTAVKKKIEIDDKAYPNFSYNYYPDEYGNENWNFQWSSADYNANISANVLGGGKIYYYGKYEYSEKRQADQIKLAKLNKTEAKNKAEAFLSKILGEEFSGYRLYQQNLGYPSDRYSLIYILNKNGYDYPNFTVYAEVDKTTGDVLSFSNYGYARYSTPAPDEIEYQDAENLISQDEALDAYLENIGLELVYSSYYDWEQKAYKVHPVYRLKNTYNQYISAKDGSLVDVVDSYG
ncbi:MAG: hypothetical protein FWH48_01680, partial [Oscillospiraceae bacterium]|nr:hypothetical protein [Oscillospiraceae bacterium]